MGYLSNTQHNMFMEDASDFDSIDSDDKGCPHCKRTGIMRTMLPKVEDPKGAAQILRPESDFKHESLETHVANIPGHEFVTGCRVDAFDKKTGTCTEPVLVQKIIHIDEEPDVEIISRDFRLSLGLDEIKIIRDLLGHLTEGLQIPEKNKTAKDLYMKFGTLATLLQQN